MKDGLKIVLIWVVSFIFGWGLADIIGSIVQ